MKRKITDITHQDLANHYFEALKVQAKMFKNGRMSHSEYTSHVLRAYNGLKRLGLNHEQAESILKGVEKVAG